MKYFTIKELTYSKTAIEKHIDNEPSEEIISNLEKLVDNVLDPLRKAYGKPITVNSGYRSPELNKAVNGSKTSDHVYGRAADITVFTKEGNKKLFDLILKLGLPFDQLINESDYSWVHVSYRDKHNRNQVLKL